MYYFLDFRRNLTIKGRIKKGWKPKFSVKNHPVSRRALLIPSSKQESMGLVVQNLCFIKKTNLLSQVEDP